MKSLLKIASAFLLLAWTSITLNAQTHSSNLSWESVKKQAAMGNKLIFVDLYFTGCMPCAQMDKEVFPDPKVASFLEKNFVIFKSDILKDEFGKKLCMKYGVTGFPTFLFMNPDGKIIDIAEGFQSVDQFVTLLQGAKDNAKKGVFKKYNSQIQEKEYPGFYQQAYMENKRNISFDTVDSYLKAQPSLMSEIPFVVIKGLAIGGEYDDFFLKNVNVFEKDYGRSSVASHVFTILKRKKKEFQKANDLTSFKKMLEEQKTIFTPDQWVKFENALLKDFGVVKTSNN